MASPTPRASAPSAPAPAHETRTVALPDEQATAALARELALFVRPGDTICLFGDLGAGKTAFARALIRALADDETLEVPSPTFTLVQAYETPRMGVSHVDLYRVSGPDEAVEIGLADTPRDTLALVEWPDRAGDLLPAGRLDIALEEVDTGDAGRRATLTGYGRCAALVRRMADVETFLDGAGWGAASRRYLQGDASTRRYERLVRPGETRLLMDMPPQPDGPPVRDGLPYSRIAHLAEDVRPVVAIGAALREIGISVPAIHAADLDRGLALIEDLGDGLYGRLAARGEDMSEPMAAAVDLLIALARADVPRDLELPDGTRYALPAFDRDAREIEAGLLLDWFWPLVNGALPPGDAAESFRDAWRALWPFVEAGPQGLMLRDYHSPNLIWLPERDGIARVGVIDYQDAVIGHAAYDLAALLQDARIDIPPQVESDLLDYYTARRAAEEPDFDAARFRAAYAVLGAQRATKILGIFARLDRRDGKPGYLRHLPRVSQYLERNLRHEPLKPLRDWFAAHLPEDARA